MQSNYENKEPLKEISLNSNGKVNILMDWEVIQLQNDSIST